MRFGLMAVFAVSGSMVFLVHQVHKRILSNFMKKFEFEMGGMLYPRGHKNLSGMVIFILQILICFHFNYEICRSS